VLYAVSQVSALSFDRYATRTCDHPIRLVQGARVPGVASFDLPVPGGSLAADLAEKRDLGICDRHTRARPVRTTSGNGRTAAKSSTHRALGRGSTRHRRCGGFDRQADRCEPSVVIRLGDRRTMGWLLRDPVFGKAEPLDSA